LSGQQIRVHVVADITDGSHACELQAQGIGIPSGVEHRFE
jgi:hypothetical protein